MYFVIESSPKSDNVIGKFQTKNQALHFSHNLRCSSEYCDYYVTEIIG